MIVSRFERIPIASVLDGIVIVLLAMHFLGSLFLLMLDRNLKWRMHPVGLTCLNL